MNPKITPSRSSFPCSSTSDNTVSSTHKRRSVEAFYAFLKWLGHQINTVSSGYGYSGAGILPSWFCGNTRIILFAGHKGKTACEAQPRRLIPGKGHLRTVIYSGSKAACNPVWGLLQSLVECILEAFFCNCFNIPRDLGGAVMQLWSVFRL